MAYTRYDKMNPEPRPNPYEDLYIYYLQGRLNSSGVTFNGTFIGNWEEDGFSFLFFFFSFIRYCCFLSFAVSFFPLKIFL